MSALSKKFESIVNGMNLALVDFTTLDVLTISGNIKSILSKEGKIIKPVDLILNYDAEKTDVRVEAFTHVDFDQDVIQFYRDGIQEEDLTYKLHQQAVESSKAARLGVLTFIKEVVS
ncbi:MAG: hypothetical protein JNL03_10490 [Prolixibacteraceae bacterium]|nr:hypothetical protein [Prolixibacteraceae bacterium]